MEDACLPHSTLISDLPALLTPSYTFTWLISFLAVTPRSLYGPSPICVHSHSPLSPPHCPLSSTPWLIDNQHFPKLMCWSMPLCFCLCCSLSSEHSSQYTSFPLQLLTWILLLLPAWDWPRHSFSCDL